MSWRVVRLTLVSDAHLAELDDPAQDALVRFLRSWPSDEWVLVGDIADVWWDWQHAVFSAYVPLLAALRERVQAGNRVTWVPGNHDFRPGRAVENLGVSVVTPFCSVVHGTRVTAVHGDQADLRRRQKVLNALLRGSFGRRIMSLAGPDRAWRLGSRVSSASREGHGVPTLGQDQADLADRLLARADVVVMGHSHVLGLDHRAGGLLMNLGDWVHQRSFGVIDSEGARLLRWVDGQVVSVTR